MGNTAHQSTEHQDDLARACRKQAAVKTNKEWLKAFRTIEDSSLAREAWAMGEAYRESQKEP